MNLYPLIKVLSDGQSHTGTSLGRQLGISRTAIWKQIQQLPGLGLDYTTDKATGYALTNALDLLDESALKADLLGLGSSLRPEVFPQIDSTNTELARRLQSGQSIHGALLLAEMQTAGRGRRGRSWVSPFASSLSLSLGWQFEGAANQLQGLSLAVGVVTHNVLKALGYPAPGLKWPNDIQIADAKLGGILIEVSGDLAGPCQLIIGLGLNVRRSASLLSLDRDVTFLSDLQADLVTRSALALQLARSLECLLQDFAVSGFRPWQDAWNAVHCWKGREGLLITPHGEEVVVFGDVNAEGELEVFDLQGCSRFINAGEVSLRVAS